MRHNLSSFYRLDTKTSEEAARPNVVANGVSDVDPAHGAHAAVMKATRSRLSRSSRKLQTSLPYRRILRHMAM